MGSSPSSPTRKSNNGWQAYFDNCIDDDVMGTNVPDCLFSSNGRALV